MSEGVLAGIRQPVPISATVALPPPVSATNAEATLTTRVPSALDTPLTMHVAGLTRALDKACTSDVSRGHVSRGTRLMPPPLIPPPHHQMVLLQHAYAGMEQTKACRAETRLLMTEQRERLHKTEINRNHLTQISPSHQRPTRKLAGKKGHGAGRGRPGVHRVCDEDGCKQVALFGDVAAGGPRRCRAHKAPSHRIIRGWTACLHAEGCKRKSSFGFPSGRPIYCSAHKSAAQHVSLSFRGRTCLFRGCRKQVC
jgi:hypothetical protein